MLRNLFSILLVFVCVAANGAVGDPIVFASHLTRTELNLGDSVQYELSVEWDPRKIEITQPVLDSHVGEFEVLKVESQEAIATQPSLKKKIWDLTLVSFSSGEYEIPSIEMDYRLNGEVKQGEFPPMKVRVASGIDPALKAGEIFPLKPPMSIEPDPRYRNRVIMLAVLAMAGIALAIYLIRRWRRRERTSSAAPVVDPRTPEQIALDEIAALREQDLPAVGKVKIFYTIAADILRAYLGRKFEIAALDMTTSELMSELRNRESVMGLHSPIERVLSDADKVKFAKWNPQMQHSEETLFSIERLVKDVQALAAPIEPERAEVAS